MKAVSHFVVWGAILLASTAAAQPMLVMEHDWTFQVGSQQYGLQQWSIVPGKAQQWTTVCIGRPLGRVSMRAEALLGIVVVPVGIVLTLALKQRPR